MINRRSRFGIVDFSEGDNNDNEIVYYCDHCEKYGFKIPLFNRIYLEGSIPPDADQWKQCFECGTIFAIHELIEQTRIENLIETIENPFESANNQFLGVDSRKTRRKARNKKDLFGDITDDEVQQELSKGNTLISYFEHIPQ